MEEEDNSNLGMSMQHTKVQYWFQPAFTTKIDDDDDDD